MLHGAIGLYRFQQRRYRQHQEKRAYGLIPNDLRRPHYLRNNVLGKPPGVIHLGVFRKPDDFVELHFVFMLSGFARRRLPGVDSMSVGLEKPFYFDSGHTTGPGCGNRLTIRSVLYIARMINTLDIGARAAVRNDVAVRI